MAVDSKTLVLFCNLQEWEIQCSGQVLFWSSCKHRLHSRQKDPETCFNTLKCHSLLSLQWKYITSIFIPNRRLYSPNFVPPYSIPRKRILKHPPPLFNFAMTVVEKRQQELCILGSQNSYHMLKIVTNIHTNRSCLKSPLSSG